MRYVRAHVEALRNGLSASLPRQPDVHFDFAHQTLIPESYVDCNLYGAPAGIGRSVKTSWRRRLRGASANRSGRRPELWQELSAVVVGDQLYVSVELDADDTMCDTSNHGTSTH